MYIDIKRLSVCSHFEKKGLYKEVRKRKKQERMIRKVRKRDREEKRNRVCV